MMTEINLQELVAETTIFQKLVERNQMIQNLFLLLKQKESEIEQLKAELNKRG